MLGAQLFGRRQLGVSDERFKPLIQRSTSEIATGGQIRIPLSQQRLFTSDPSLPLCRCLSSWLVCAIIESPGSLSTPAAMTCVSAIV
jgi:hypothetical protein